MTTCGGGSGNLLLMGLLHWGDQVFMAGKATGKPPLSYVLADSYLARQSIDQACEEYLKIVNYYPAELSAYVAALSLMVTHYEQQSPALRLFLKGMLKLPMGDRRVLPNVFQSLGVADPLMARCKLALALTRVIA